MRRRVATRPFVERIRLPFAQHPPGARNVALPRARDCDDYGADPAGLAMAAPVACREAYSRGESGASAPALTVIVPAYRCAGTLRASLTALRASDLPRSVWELIVVDDASDDDTPAVAAALADRVLRVAGGPRGPAFARNGGAEAARGRVLVFADADVCVHPDALRRLLDAFVAEPALGAVFGAYDTAPPAPGLVSRYCNLTHHWTHARAAGPAETFWAGCGAVPRDVFQRAGGFDEARYPRPQIEDIELGHRIRDLGLPIMLRPEIRGTHLKRWTLRAMIRMCVRDRGAPWVELLLTEHAHSPRTSALNLAGAEKTYTALVALAGVAALVAVAAGDARWLWAAMAALGAVLLGNVFLLRWLTRQGGAELAAAGAALRLLYYALNGVSVVWGTWRHVRARRSPASRVAHVRAPLLVEVHQPLADVRQPLADVRQPLADVRQPLADVRQPLADVRQRLGAG